MAELEYTKKYFDRCVYQLYNKTMSRKRRWTISQLQHAVSVSKSYRHVVKLLGLQPAGGSCEHIKKYIKEYDLDIEHFTGKIWNKNMRGIGKPYIPLEKILVKGSTYDTYKLKNRLYKVGIKSPTCEMCGWAEQSTDGRIPLELDHINGDPSDHRLENLRVLCPNCHSLQPTHRGRNKKSAKARVVERQTRQP